MRLFSSSLSQTIAFAGIALFLTFASSSSFAAPTLNQQIDPSEATVGDQVTVTFTFENCYPKKKASSSFFGSFMPTYDIPLPTIDGLRYMGQSSQSITGNVQSKVIVSFIMGATRAGDITIPAFDIPMDDGSTLRTQLMKLHVINGAMSPPTTVQVPLNPGSNSSGVPSITITTNPAFNPNGPVVMPPKNSAPPASNGAPNPTDNTSDNAVHVPMERDGRPGKVFVIITPDTTDAYVGESIPLRIDWYIRQDVDYNQDSLPTIKGSDFLMNSLSVHPVEDTPVLMNEPYHRQTWYTAISAPKSGDFSLSMTRDTYWIKASQANGNSNDPFAGFFQRPTLAHEPIPSNELTIHVHSLPTQGRPINFSGGIGHFKVSGNAQPTSVAVGDPVTIHYNITGDGNFDYVRCPTLANDPAWKTYVPSSKMNYADESRTQGTKLFDQAVIPQKNGTVPLPQSSFSYFDPTTKQYVTTPISLPAITVTGTATPTPPTSPSGDADSATVAAGTNAPEFMPNRLDVGSPRTNIAPVYRQIWFWAVQVALGICLFLGALMAFFFSKSTPKDDRAEQRLRERSRQQEEDAMSEAVKRNDARTFFVAARHAVQLRLGNQWKLKPEAITLGEIRQRDSQLAERLEPLFNQVDEVIYSGQASPDLNLAEWEVHVRKDLLQPQSA